MPDEQHPITLRRGVPRLMSNGAWGAQVEGGAAPGDYVEITARSGRRWIARVAEVIRNRDDGTAVVSAEPLPAELQDEIRSAGVGITTTPPVSERDRRVAQQDQARREHGDRLIAMSHALTTEFQPAAPAGRSLFPEQRAGVEYVLAQDGDALIADEPGVGKTAQALVVANERDARKILIVAPGNTLANWQREARQWLTDPLPVDIADGDRFPVQPADAQGVAIMSYDSLGRFREQLRDVDWDLVVLDEAHRIKDPGSQRTQEIIGCVAGACAAVPRYDAERERWIQPDHPAPPDGITPLQADDRVLLSGTPMVKNPMDLWAAVNYIAPDYWGRMTRREFHDRYIDDADRTGRTLRNTQEFNDRLRESVMVRRKMEDVHPEMPAKFRRIIGLNLDPNSPTGWDAKADIEENLANAPITSQGLPGMTRISRALDAYSRIKAPIAADYVAGAVRDNPDDRIIFFSKHVNMGDALERTLRAQGIPFTRVQGGMSDADKQGQIDRFATGEYPVMIATLGTLKEGSNLQRANRVLFGEVDWNSTDLQQAENRAWRRGQTRPVVVEYLMLNDSLDADVARIALEKQRAINEAIGGSSGNDIGTSGDHSAQAEIAASGGLAEKLRQIRQSGAQRRSPAAAPPPLAEAGHLVMDRPVIDGVADDAPPSIPAAPSLQTDAPPPPIVDAPPTLDAPTIRVDVDGDDNTVRVGDSGAIGEESPADSPHNPSEPVSVVVTPPEPETPATAPAAPSVETKGNIRPVPLDVISIRPDLFQFRSDVGGYDKAAVDKLVDAWDWDEYDPIAVVADPDTPGGYIVIAGHHRLEAMLRLHDENPGQYAPGANARILSGDVATPESRDELRTRALLSNYSIRGTSLLEDADGVQYLHNQGQSVRQIADGMEIKPGKVRDLLAFSRLHLGDRQLVQNVPDFYPMAVELGHAVGNGMSPDEAAGLLLQFRNSYDETGNIPNRQVVKNMLALKGVATDTGTQSTFALGDTQVFNAVRAMVQENTAMEQEIRSLRSRLTQCENLAETTGADLSAMRTPILERIELLRETLAARHRALLADRGDGELELPSVPVAVMPGSAPEPVAVATDMTTLKVGRPTFIPVAVPGPGPEPVTTATDMFGNRVQITPMEPEDADEADHAPFVQSGPDLFGATEPAPIVAPPVVIEAVPPLGMPIHQVTMGDDFATNRMIDMSIGQPPVVVVPLADPDSLMAAQQRRAMIDAGQTELPTPTVAIGVGAPELVAAIPTAVPVVELETSPARVALQAEHDAVMSELASIRGKSARARAARAELGPRLAQLKRGIRDLENAENAALAPPRARRSPDLGAPIIEAPGPVTVRRTPSQTETRRGLSYWQRVKPSRKRS